MGFDRRFSIGLALRLVMAMACLAALAWALMTPDLGAVRILCAIGAAVSAMALWHHVRRANFELARFVEAIEFGDLQARFAGRDRTAASTSWARRSIAASASCATIGCACRRHRASMRRWPMMRPPRC